MEGIIFDFNGVLLWDNHLHEDAWRHTSTQLRGVPLSDEEMKHHVHGRTNGDIFTYILGRPVDGEELRGLAEEKEALYRRLALAAGHTYRLSPGAADLLHRLMAGAVPCAIATSSPPVNVDFFIERLDLHRWFDAEHIIFDRGLYPGKPAPGIYLEAAERLGLPPGRCAVVEDSVAGIQSAFAAGVGAIVAVGPADEHETLAALPGVTAVIGTLAEFPDGFIPYSPHVTHHVGRAELEVPLTRAAYYVELLRLARESIAHYLATGEMLPYATDNAWVLQPAAVFVTLRVAGEPESADDTEDDPQAPGALRGCIGQIEARLPLYAAVQDAAVKAATRDPRFVPVTADELDGLAIEVSVLSPPKPVGSLDEIVIGRDGLYIIAASERGILLPEVAVRYEWDAAAFVEALHRKAGLPPGAWPNWATLYAFTTESFGEL